MVSFKSIDIVFEVGNKTCIGHFIYPFGSGIEDKIPVRLGQIQVPILALDSSMIHIPKIC